MSQGVVVKKPRLLSLDFFRGLTIAAMILVNTPGDWDYIYAPLEHSKWNGCTPTDLVFPFFLFMVGVSIVYAIQSRKHEQATHSKILLNAFRRMIVLILLGLGIYLFYRPDFVHLRFPGVLQRIGVVYFIATVLYLKTSARTQNWLFGIILLSYYLVMTMVPLPDGHPPNLTPQYNLAAWIDRAVFTTNHIARFTKDWDPVGLLSTWPAIATVLFGIRVGEILKAADKAAATKCKTLLVTGSIATLLGLASDMGFPINKQLWTSSYVLYTGGLCTLGLTLAYWLIDVKGFKNYAWIFTVFGVNAITAYVLSEVVPGLLNFIRIAHEGKSYNTTKYVYQIVLLPYFQPINASLVFACVFVVFMWLLMYILYIKKIFIKI